MILQVLVAFALSQGPPLAGTPEELNRIEQELAATWRKGDCSAWGATLAPEWAVTHIDGSVITKAEALRMCKAPRPPIEELTIDQVSVRAYGDAAVVTGRTTMTTGGEKPATLRIRFTDVFIRRAGRWQVVASHASQLGS
jgi:ketosteroid isomerase-like protein